MDASRSNCPVDQLEWYVNRTLSTAQRSAIDTHLAECALCRAEIEIWIELRQVMRDVSAQTPQPHPHVWAQIERQIETPKPSRWLQMMGHSLIVCGEYIAIQTRLIRRELFWVPLILLPVASWAVDQHPADITAVLVVLLTAFGKAFLYGAEVDPPREMILATPTSPQMVLATRCSLIFGYDLLLNCGLVLPFLAWQGIVTPGWFLESWLAPLCFLSAVALLLSILINSGTALFICTFLWGLRLLNHVQFVPWQQHYENFWHQGVLLSIAAILALFLAFAVLEQKERFA